MNMLAASAVPQPAPVQQMPAQTYQNTTTQPSAPPPRGYKIAIVPLVLSAVNLIVIILIVIMIYRFVRAFEKIANSIDKGIVIKKDDTTT